VADISFIFDNADLLGLLAQRAEKLKRAKFDDAEKIEKAMTKAKEEHFDAVTRPTLAYVTFRHEDAQNAFRALGDFEFLGETIKVRKHTKEPTNFYWENVQVTSAWRNVRGAAILLLMVVLFVGFFFAAMWAIKRKLLIEYFKDPPGVECDDVVDFHGDQLVDMAAYEYLTHRYHTRTDGWEVDLNA
jgi:hypothetical protein